MKILFFTKMNFGYPENSGIYKKVLAQVKALEQHGFVVDLLYKEKGSVKLKSIKGNKSWDFSNTLVGKVKSFNFFFDHLLKKIDIASYDHMYIRHFPSNPAFIGLLKKIKRLHPSINIFMEIACYPYAFEFDEMQYGKVKKYFDDKASKRFKEYIDYIITFSKDVSIYGVPTIKTANGIDPDSIPLQNIPEDNSVVQLIGVANLQKWHGYDRIIKGMAKHYQKKDPTPVHFHIVGNGVRYDMLRKLTDELKLQEHITLYGHKSGEDLHRIFKRSHIGIGSCGMHRIHVADGETSTLKAREYTARGLPFVIGYKDRDFPEDYPYLLRVPADESIIDIDLILKFYHGLGDNYPSEMRSFAEKYLSWKSKFEPIIKTMILKK